MPTKRNVFCKHVRNKTEKDTIYVWDLFGLVLHICHKCNKELQDQMIDQTELEDSLS